MKSLIQKQILKDLYLVTLEMEEGFPLEETTVPAKGDHYTSSISGGESDDIEIMLEITFEDYVIDPLKLVTEIKWKIFEKLEKIFILESSDISGIPQDEVEVDHLDPLPRIEYEEETRKVTLTLNIR